MTTPRLKPRIPVYSAQVTRPKAQGYNIQVNDLWFRTVASKDIPIQLGTRDSLAPRADDTGSTYNNILEIGYAWGRTDLSGGEGLDWDPRALAIEQGQEALDAIRFWDSVGLDTSRPSRGEKYSLHLAHTLETWGGTTSDPKDITTTLDHIYVADGDTISWYSSWSNTTAVGSDTPVAATDIVALAASPIGTVMAVLADGNVWAMRAYPSETSFSSIYAAGDATGIWFANGRFIISTSDGVDEGTLVALEWNGTSYSPPIEIDTAFGDFVSVTESGPAIVAACTDGTLRTYTPDTGTAGLPLLPRARTTMPKGETPIVIGSNAGVLLVMTTSESSDPARQFIRMYQAEVLDVRFDYVIGNLQLKREWYGDVHLPTSTRNIASTRDEMFWFVREDFDGTLYEGLWRYDLVTGGLTRFLSIPTVDYTSITVFDEIIGAIDFIGGSIDIGSTDYEGFGYMIFPNMTFGLNTDISWLAVTLETQNLLLSGGTVELWGSPDPDAISDYLDPSWELLLRVNASSSEESTIQLSDKKSRTYALQLRVYATAGTETPTISRVAVRGIPSHRDYIMMVPFNVSDYVSVPGRMPLHVPSLGNALHSTVMDMVGDSVNVTVLDPPMDFRGVMNNVSEPVTFQPPRGSMTTYVMVEFRGEIVGDGAVSGALTPQPDGFAVSAMGLSTSGVDEQVS